MRLFNYLVSSNANRNQWLDSFRITSGLRYFGGKAVIGKYLMNHICNMACRMYVNGDKPQIFIDGFTGGGKIGLSIPDGWFDTIVMNDLNYGVYSFFKSCKENPTALVKMIETMGEIYDEDVFRYFALNRSNGNQPVGKYTEAEQLIHDLEIKKQTEELDEYERSQLSFYTQNKPFINDIKLDEIVAGAMTYWVTQTTWNGDTDPVRVTYRYKRENDEEERLTNAKEKEKIAQAVHHAQKHIFRVHKLMKRKNIIIENMDYRELIKKYNGLAYKDISEVERSAEEQWAKKNKLWYFDPPYHASTLCGESVASYEDSFPLEMTKEMTSILANKKSKTYGELNYFIKSDYDPRLCLKQAIVDLKNLRKNMEKYESDDDEEEDEETKGSKLKADLEKRVEANWKSRNDFRELERGIYKKIEVGTFDKGGISGEEKTKGTEFIWTRG